MTNESLIEKLEAVMVNRPCDWDYALTEAIAIVRQHTGLTCDDEGCPHYGEPHGHAKQATPDSSVIVPAQEVDPSDIRPGKAVFPHPKASEIRDTASGDSAGGMTVAGEPSDREARGGESFAPIALSPTEQPIEPPAALKVSPKALYKNIRHFVQRWKKLPADDSPQALDVISDFMLCMGTELDFRVPEQPPGQPVHPTNKAEWVEGLAAFLSDRDTSARWECCEDIWQANYRIQAQQILDWLPDSFLPETPEREAQQPVGPSTAEAIAFGDGYNKGYAAAASEREAQQADGKPTRFNMVALRSRLMEIVTTFDPAEPFLPDGNLRVMNELMAALDPYLRATEREALFQESDEAPRD